MTSLPQPADENPALPAASQNRTLRAVAAVADSSQPTGGRYVGVFPDAPAPGQLPSTATQTTPPHRFSLVNRLRNFVRAHRIGCAVFAAIVMLLIILMGPSNFLFLCLVLSPILVPAVLVGAVIMAVVASSSKYQSTRDAFYESYGTARGLTWWIPVNPNAGKRIYSPKPSDLDSSHLNTFITSGCTVPPRIMGGHIGRSPQGGVLDIQIPCGRDSNATTVVVMQLPDPIAARFTGVTCCPRGVGFAGVYEHRFGYRKHQFESAAFDQAYEVEVDPQQDMTALYQLFTPAFLARLAGGYEVVWWQAGSSLVVPAFCIVKDADHLDELCLRASLIYQQYAAT